MVENAIDIEGFDEVTRKNVRIQLRVVTSEESNAVVTRFAAPRGFLPEPVARGSESRNATRAFAAPRGFLPEC